MSQVGIKVERSPLVSAALKDEANDQMFSFCFTISFTCNRVHILVTREVCLLFTVHSVLGQDIVCSAAGASLLYILSTFGYDGLPS